MDTKSKETKRYPLYIKALCVVLSLMSVIGMYGCLLYAATVIEALLPRDDADLMQVLSGSVYESALLRNVLYSDLYAVSDLITCPQSLDRLSGLEKQRDTIVEKETQRYLQQKAAIIRDEIFYVATHYDDTEGGFDYEAYMRDFAEDATQPEENTTALQQNASTNEPATDVSVQEPAETQDSGDALPRLTVDERAPYNVRYCQKLVNTVTGLEWLQYAPLVRQKAFTEQTFRPDFGGVGSRVSQDFLMNETEIRSILAQEFDATLQEAQRDRARRKEQAESQLGSVVNLKYLAVSPDGTVFTNMAEAEQAEQAIRRQKYFFICRDGKAESSPGASETWQEMASGVQTVARDADAQPFTLSFYVLDPLQSGDRYAAALRQFEQLKQVSPAFVLTVGIVCAAALLISVIALLWMCGHKAGADGITLAFIDRVPTDVHTVLIGMSGIVLVFLLVTITENVEWWKHMGSGSLTERAAAYVLLPGILCTGFLLCLEWLTSTVRIKKSGQSFFRRFVLWKAIRLVFRAIRFVLRQVKKAALYVLEKPKKIRYVFLLVTLLYASASFLWIGIVAGGLNEPGAAVFGFLLLTVVYILFFLRYLRTLDAIIDLSGDRAKLPIPDTDRMPPALRTLADNMYVTSRELDEAVAQAVRNERTKAELITNVSHDLKTPLTSVISYVDLLKQCDITDETAKGYLVILDEKSANLKRLVEDLIEASKVSTGNITLHCTALNLAELAMQAVVEATRELEARGLEVKFTQSENVPIICADGSKTYRILENLLSNVKKYAADHSRVYIRVGEEDGCGVFEIKNVSAEPLDVDPQELLERFVRGDRSRTREGNGLGLSIAQQLCTLQGGRLDVRIDGDLFKAAVYLPMQNAEEGSVETE